MTTNNKAAPPSKAGDLGTTASPNRHKEHTPPLDNSQAITVSCNTTDNQLSILFSWLKSEGEIDTMEARRHGVNHVAGRINDLRNQGIKIETSRTRAIDQKSKIIAVALYVLPNNSQLFLLGLG